MDDLWSSGRTGLIQPSKTPDISIWSLTHTWPHVCTHIHTSHTHLTHIHGLMCAQTHIPRTQYTHTHHTHTHIPLYTCNTHAPHHTCSTHMYYTHTHTHIHHTCTHTHTNMKYTPHTPKPITATVSESVSFPTQSSFSFLFYFQTQPSVFPLIGSQVSQTSFEFLISLCLHPGFWGAWCATTPTWLSNSSFSRLQARQTRSLHPQMETYNGPFRFGTGNSDTCFNTET